MAALHCVHLSADFPNYSRWMDYSKYTDEGWYANAAIQYFVRGSWYVPGDFNAGAAVPVWPFLLWLLFHLTGVSVQAARGLAVLLFGCNLLLSYRLVRGNHPLWVALLAVTLIASSSFLYCFSRLAILEPLLICLTLISLLLARRSGSLRDGRRRIGIAAAIGALFCLMILTKTTAVFLLPAILYMLWHSLRRTPGAFLRSAGTLAFVTCVLWGGYFLMLVRPRYLSDYHYFFRINIYPKPAALAGWLATVGYSLRGVLWVDQVMVATTIVLLAASFLFARRVWRDPLFVSSWMAIGGYLLFIAYIDNMQPRYYAVVAFFLIFALSLATGELLRRRRYLGIAALVALIFAAARNTWELVGFVRYPEYTFVGAARNLTDYIDRHPNGNRMLVSISGNEITLMTGLPSLCDDFGTLDLPAKLAKYNPGWYAEWNEMDPGTLEDLQTRYWLEEAATYKALDDDDRDTLVLYKLLPLPHPRDE